MDHTEIEQWSGSALLHSRPKKGMEEAEIRKRKQMYKRQSRMGLLLP